MQAGLRPGGQRQGYPGPEEADWREGQGQAGGLGG